MIYIFELISIVFNTLVGFYNLKSNHKVTGIINLVLAAILASRVNKFINTQEGRK